MGVIRNPDQVKPFCGLIYRDESLVPAVRARFPGAWGGIDLEAGPFPFDRFTDYYRPEMGAGLQRRFFSFAALLPPDDAASWKVLTNNIEVDLSGGTGAGRAVNLDPGYLNLSRIVLLTTKDHAHRIYVGLGMYAEVTLLFREGAFAALPWTYPDYRSAEYQEFFGRMREAYLGLRKVR